MNKQKKKVVKIPFLFIIVIMAIILGIVLNVSKVDVVSKEAFIEREKSSATIYGETVEGVHKDGSLEDFAKDMPVGTVFFDKSKADTVSVGIDGYILQTNGNNNIVKWVNPKNNENYVVYRGPNGNGIPAETEGYITNTSINKNASEADRTRFTIKFQDVVTMQDTTKKDVEITISNIYVVNQRTSIVPILHGWSGTTFSLRALDNEGNSLGVEAGKGIGIHCDAKVSILNKDGTPVTGEKLLFEVNDLDVGDGLRLGDNKYNYPKIDDDRFPSTYGNISAYSSDHRESVYILSGALSDAYMPSTNWLEVKRLSEGSYSNGLRFSSYGTEEDSATLNTGFLTIVDTEEFNFRWYGGIASHSAGMGTVIFSTSANHLIKATSGQGGKIRTDFDFNTSSDIITSSEESTTGSFQHNFADGVDVNYIMESDETHNLGNIKIDTVEFIPSDFSNVSAGESNKEVTITKNENDYKFIVTKDSNGRVTKAVYTFNNNQANHEISVTWNTIPTSLIIRYLEKDTNDVLAESVTKTGVVGGTYDVTADKKTIENYTYVEDSGNTTGTYTMSSSTTPIEVIYYYKLSDYGYKVEYYYDGVIDNTKTVTEEATYGSQITTYTDKVIDGYKFDKTIGLPLTISSNIDNNVVKVYYIKRNDLSYTVKYFEQDTNIELRTPKVVGDQTFGDTVTENAIDITGYSKVNPTSADIEITTGTNEHIFYYTKRNDLKGKVKYFEKGTTREIKDEKNLSNLTYQSTIAAADYNEEISGYTYDSANPETITVSTNENNNVLNLYYTKRTDLSYTVNYLEKETNNILKTAKIVPNQVIETTITSANEVININGYTYDSVDKNTLIISGENNEITIYYTKKNDLSYTVYYKDQETNEEIATKKEKENQTFGDKITEDAIDIDGYTKVNPTSAEIEITTGTNEYTFYYAKRSDLSYKVNYLEKGTNNEIKTSKVVQNKKYKDEIKAEDEVVDIDKYDYDSSDKTKLIIGTNAENNVINLYYTKKGASVTVKYVNEITGEEISTRDSQNGTVDGEYTTLAKTIEGYNLTGDSGNTTGTYTVEPITVIYYYKVKTKVTAKYIDKISGNNLTENVVKTGLEGDSYDTEVKSFENYVLLQEPINKSGNMTAEPIEVIYYYVSLSSGVIEKHINEFTGELLDSKTYSGNEGDAYTTSSKEFDGYELNNNNLPTNANGNMTKDLIEVVYYYKYKTKVNVSYKDKITGEDLTEKIVINGYEGESYTTEDKVFEKYTLEKKPDNANGNMTKDSINVVYYYIHDSAGVKVNHIDIATGEKLAPEEFIPGKEGDKYNTSEIEIDGYDLIEDKYPKNANGKMKIDEIKVNYYYALKSKVTIKYIDEITGKELTSEEVIDGHEGDNYKTEEKQFANYDIDKDLYPTNSKGKMTKDNIEVIYYYKRKAEVIAKYIDIETKVELEDRETIKGHEGDSYSTKKKDINYYILVEEPTNANGKMNEERTEVIYYYRKAIFNLSIDKKIKSTEINGNNKKINKDITKVEVKKKKISNTDVKVVYSIIVKNDGELEGKATIQENIPDGMEMSKAENKGWKINGKKATLSTGTIKPKENKEFIVTLTWKKSTENFGTKTNKVEIISTSNKAGFKEKNTEDNSDKSNFIISVSTGGKTIAEVAGIGVLALLLIFVLGVYIKRRK